MPTWAYRMMRRGKVPSVSDKGQVAVQVPQLKHAETSAAPKRWMSERSSVSTSVVTRSPPGERLHSGSSPRRWGPRPRRCGRSDASHDPEEHLVARIADVLGDLGDGER